MLDISVSEVGLYYEVREKLRQFGLCVQSTSEVIEQRWIRVRPSQ
jgi:hypothetical protein